MKEQIVDLLQNLLDCVHERGIKKTSELLMVKKRECIYDTDEYVKFVVDNICAATGVLPTDIIFGRYIRGMNKFAVGLIVYYLYPKYTIPQLQRGLFANKTKALLWQYQQIILNLNPRYKADERYIEIKEQIDDIVNKHTQNQ